MKIRPKQIKSAKAALKKAGPDYDAVVLDAGKGGMIYPVAGQQDERYQRLSAADKTEHRGKLPITKDMVLSKSDKVISASGVKVIFPTDPTFRYQAITLNKREDKGREYKVGDYAELKIGPKPEPSFVDQAKGLHFRVHRAIVGDEDSNIDPAGHGGAGVRGESVVKIKAGDLRALIREAAKRRPSGWLPATEKNLDLDKPFTADSWITNQTGVPVNVLVKNYLASMGMLEDDEE